MKQHNLVSLVGLEERRLLWGHEGAILSVFVVSFSGMATFRLDGVAHKPVFLVSRCLDMFQDDHVNYWSPACFLGFAM